MPLSLSCNLYVNCFIASTNALSFVHKTLGKSKYYCLNVKQLFKRNYDLLFKSILLKGRRLTSILLNSFSVACRHKISIVSNIEHLDPLLSINKIWCLNEGTNWLDLEGSLSSVYCLKDCLRRGRTVGWTGGWGCWRVCSEEGRGFDVDDDIPFWIFFLSSQVSSHTATS